MNGDSGFTLLELLIVIAIVGMLSSIAVAAIPISSPERDVHETADRIGSLLRAARSEALRGGQASAVRFDLDDRRILRTGGEGTLSLPETIAIEVTVAQRPAGASGRPAIAFRPDGTSSGGSVLIRGGGTERRLAVNWLTGGISADD